MPSWLVNLLVSLALKLGIPWIVQRFPGIPAEVLQIIEKLIADLQNHAVQKKQIVTTAKQACIGAQCKGK